MIPPGTEGVKTLPSPGLELGYSPLPKKKETPKAIDFSFPEEIEHLRVKVREFMEQVVRPAEEKIDANEGERSVLVEQVIAMRKAAHEQGLWLPHMPKEWGGMGLGHVAMASVS
ncbi:MAG: acyl-CoA dehydrogenase family protein, partial [Myxococcota bacterium]|nr:acyl-CoA dehydrogenase family protein [Myxococcota bacterium]